MAKNVKDQVSKVVIILIALGATSALSTSCGKNNNPGSPPVAAVPIPQIPIPVPVPNPCPNGYFFGGQCYQGASFDWACRSSGGQPLSGSSGRPLCEWEKFGFIFPSSYFPLLTPDHSNNELAWNTGITVKPGDRLEYTLTGSWGVREGSTDSFLGGFIYFSTWHLDCRDVSLNGIKEGAPAYYLNQPAGLMGTDGTEIFWMGSSGSVQIHNSGVLKIGINAPLHDAGAGCASISSQELYVLHCEDINGITYPCP